MEYIVFEDPRAVAEHAADLIAGELALGGVDLGLAGGSTPLTTYNALATRDLDWSDTVAWLTDERWVHHEHDDSNQNMVRLSLARPTGVRFLAPDTGLPSAQESAEQFTDVLTTHLGHGHRAVTLLGMGPDGHTASLFPGTEALQATGARVVANHVPQLDTWRLTATYDLLARSHIVLFLVAGANKAEMILSVAEGADVPAAAVTARERVVWLLDEASARLIS